MLPPLYAPALSSLLSSCTFRLFQYIIAHQASVVVVICRMDRVRANNVADMDDLLYVANILSKIQSGWCRGCDPDPTFSTQPQPRQKTR
jgi:hypothetical protein